MKPMHFGILTLLLAAWAIFAIHQRALATRSGYAIQHLERERQKLLEDNRKIQCEIAALMEPARIAREVERLGLNLVDPVESRREQARGGQPANR